MITWMQKHRKYLVITIWISTIAFVGAGFVGWGTYQYGKQSHNVAMVGDVPITIVQYQHAYDNLYRRYNEMLGGRLDEATAEKLGLRKQVLQSLIYQALMKNFANEHGIIVSDEEVQKAILAIPAFQKNGHFDKSTYLAMLQNMRMKPATFEASLKDELLMQKTLSLLDPDALPLETEAFGAALLMADRIRYQVFDAASVQVDTDEKALHAYWEAHKKGYMTPIRYRLGLLWTEADQQMPTDKEIEAYYHDHRSEFTDEKGMILPLEKVRNRVATALRLHHAKRKAQLSYIDLKKGKRTAEQTLLLEEGDATLTPELWREVEAATPKTVLKPKIVHDRYVVVQLLEVQSPKPKTFEEAKADVQHDYLMEKRMKKAIALAEKASTSLTEGEETDFLTRESIDALSPLSKAETSAFLNKLFTSKQPSGIVKLNKKVIAYKILEQKLLTDKEIQKYTQTIRRNAGNVKSRLIQDHLAAQLQQRYAIEIYRKDVE